MYEITVTKYFDAAHYLRGYQGKCEAMHGHRYKVVVRVKAERLNDIGLAYDFTDLKRHLGDILERMDHTCLNDVPPFDKINPSSENIAAAIYQELKGKLDDGHAYAEASAGKGEGGVTLSAVEAWETPEQGVSYTD